MPKKQHLKLSATKDTYSGTKTTKQQWRKDRWVMLESITYHYKWSVGRRKAQRAFHHAQNHSLCSVSQTGKLACHESFLITPTNASSPSRSERARERECFGKMENTVTPHSAPLGGQRGGDRDKVQRVAEVSCNAQSTTTSFQPRVKTAHDQLNNCLIFPGSWELHFLAQCDSINH